MQKAGTAIEECSKDEWLKKIKQVQVGRLEMNRLIMNYLEKEGFKEAAEKFRDESGLSHNVDTTSLDQRIQIKESIQNGNISHAIKLVNDLHPELLDTEALLYFHLQQQQLIELIRQNDVEKALDFAQAHMAEQAISDSSMLQELERTLALLAFDSPESSPFGDLLHTSHRLKVASEVNAKILELDNQEPTPRLERLLKHVLWSQSELDKKKVKFPRMTDFACGDVEMPPK